MTGRSMRQRIAAVAVLFAVLFSALALRVVQLTTVQSDGLKQRADRQHHSSVQTTATRGSIVDRFGEPLALSRDSASVYLRPREFQPDAVNTVARLLDMPRDVVLQRATAAAPFVWLRRQVPMEQWNKVEDLKLRGIGSEPTRQRVYPHGPLAAHVLGFTNVDGQGLEGIERAFDAELRGGVQALVVGHDAWGRQFEMGDGWGSLPRAGAHVELTIDVALQRVAEEELERAVHQFQARAGSLVALDPNTGEVLAMANVPRFDPNHIKGVGPETYRNRAVTDVYEPGSTFKAFLASAALEEQVVRPEDRINCENGHYTVGNRTIRDSHPHGVLTFADVIAESSNIGCAKVAERLGVERFGKIVRAFGFGLPTGVDLPGESGGLLRPVEKWGRIHLVTTAFGQGIAVTPLQMARGFAAIANGGDLLRPYIVKRITDDSGTVRYAATPHLERRVMSKRTARAVTELLVGVTEHGTGKQARIDGFQVAGKTGTAQKVDPGTGRYSARDRMSSFIGFVPAENPALVILAVLDSPRSATYGGVVAAPVFKAVAEYGLARRGILPSVEPPVEPAPAPPALRRAAVVEPEAEVEEVADEIATPGGVPSFLGLPMRAALVRAQANGWAVRVEGSGYVSKQTPLPGAVAADRTLTLYFSSSAS
ncbi:MAG TPA: penicillin-binding transpeptidase domain-containing protein [Candidatus Dormibacteraeota bacterium]|nr:penicillin-binding transpeptidase domain-containing protein [Candidatus Dormibacteraeota bacterium]